MVAPKTTNFQFITSINTVNRDDETRRKVRSHARRQKLSSESSGSSQPRKSTTQEERTSKFRVKPSKATNEAAIGKDRKSGGNNCPPAILHFNNAGSSDAVHDSNLEPTMVTQELALVVAKELPSFPMLAIETTPLTETLLKYCFTVCLCPKEAVVSKWFDRAGAPTYMMTYYSGFLANAFAMNPLGNFFDALHVDTAISHSFLALVASMHNTLARWDDTRTFDFHRFQAIKAVNERLNVEGKRPGVPVSDGIVLAVALLVNNETFTGAIEAAGAHMSGLQRIVDLRGGILEGFKADFSYASVSGQPLVFPLVPEIASSLSLHDHFRERSIQANVNSSGRTDLVVHNVEIMHIFELLFSITRCLGSFDYSSLTDASNVAERVQLSDSIYLAERQLFQLEGILRTTQIESVFPHGIDLSIALTYAAHLFVHLCLRGQPTNAPRHRVLLESLVVSLYPILWSLDLTHNPEPHGSPRSQYSAGSPSNSSHYSLSTATTNTSVASTIEIIKQSANEIHKDFLLWILFIGSCVRLPSAPRHFQDGFVDDNHRFFLYAFQSYCLQRSILNKDILTAKLRDVVWLDNWCENQLDLIWAEIGFSSSLPSPSRERVKT
ncbi:hypothetical protein F5Y16DRAFT_412532 [Xylariaceae sp. FL0255]|nr:hypothetical protein F5Y16DRAFT_412532 [Xylariaceae sp. FL0255]